MGVDDPFEEDDDHHVPFEEKKNVKHGNPKAIIRICDLCGKTFIGGKALGGHRRSHFQTKKVAAKMGCCCICKKDFPSMRSLFGHMRAHPDRDWKGIQPPRKSRSSTMADSADDDDDEDDNNGPQLIRAKSDTDVLLKSVSSWSKTERRRRISTGAVAAAQILVSISRGENPTQLPEYSCSINQAAIEVRREEKQRIVKKKKAKSWVEKLRDCEESEATNGEKVGENCYKCSTCDKSFRTFQGLGGHRSIHNKDKNREATNIVASFADTFRIDEGEESNKTFPSPGEASQTGPRRMDFDLNQPYDMEDEDVY
jgi:hypothetical protein